MKFKTHGMVLSLLFALGLVFSFGINASAHEGSHSDGQGTTADNVDPTMKGEVEALLTHIIDYYNQEYVAHLDDLEARTRAIIVFGRQIRRDSENGGLYKDGDVYSMALNESGIVTNHGGYPNDRYGWVFDPDAQGSAVASTIQDLIAGSTVDGAPVCEDYGQDGRVACATKVRSDLGPITVIAGLHHAENDPAFVPPDCSDFTLTTTAQQVFESQSDADLEAYVEGVIELAQNQRAATFNAQFAEFQMNRPTDLANLFDPTSDAARDFGIGMLQKVYSKVACFGTGDLKHGNIYSFIMSADPAAASVLFNGNNFDLNGATLELNDDQLPGDDKSITGLFARALEGTDSAYVNYHWDDPTTADDNVENFFENRKVPGTSCKRSYIKVANLNEGLPPGTPEDLFIFGSGTYPGDEVCASGESDDMPEMPESDDDDGCAIAGAEHTSQSTLLNLFLIASVLFSVVFLRRRV